MEIKCPRHGYDLSIEHSKLKLSGELTPVVFGICPECRNRYINRALVMSASIFTIAETRYEYLPALGKAFPYDPVAEKKMAIEEEQRRKQEMQRNAQKTKKQERATRKRKVAAAAKKAALKKNPHATFRPAYAIRCEKIPASCPSCREKLVSMRFFKRGVTENKGWCCVECSKVYLLNSQDKERNGPDRKENGNNKIELPESIVDVPASAIVVATMYMRENGQIGMIAIVSDQQEQDSKRGIYWVGRTLPSMVLSAIQTGRVIFEYNGKSYEIKNYTTYSSAKKYFDVIGRFCNREAPQEVFVFSQKNIAIYQSGSYEVVTAMVPCANRNVPVPITVYYEKATKRYFMNEESYVVARKNYGLPYLRLCVAAASDTNGVYGELKEHSELNLLGYSVGINGLDFETRRKLLSNVIDSGVLGKPEIINHLEWLIHTRKNMANMENAIAEWREDLRFVSQYKMQKQRSIWVGAFKAGSI